METYFRRSGRTKSGWCPKKSETRKHQVNVAADQLRCSNVHTMKTHSYQIYWQTKLSSPTCRSWVLRSGPASHTGLAGVQTSIKHSLSRHRPWWSPAAFQAKKRKQKWVRSSLVDSNTQYCSIPSASFQDCKGSCIFFTPADGICHQIPPQG